MLYEVITWAQAEPGERVAFQISTRGGPALLQGDTFLTDAGMHWRLTVLNRKTRPLGDFNLASEPWRLVPLPGQRYVITSYSIHYTKLYEV